MDGDQHRRHSQKSERETFGQRRNPSHSLQKIHSGKNRKSRKLVVTSRVARKKERSRSHKQEHTKDRKQPVPGKAPCDFIERTRSVKAKSAVMVRPRRTISIDSGEIS